MIKDLSDLENLAKLLRSQNKSVTKKVPITAT